MQDFVSIVIPVYKQEKSIRKDIKNIYKVMTQTRWDFEIIVVVDGFVDKTFEKLRGLGLRKIRVYGYKENRGKGYAVRYGMARSRGNYIAFIDAGMDIDPNGISMVLEHMVWYEADIIVASKFHPASKVTFRSFVRKIYSLGYSFLVKLLFDFRINDTQTGLKVYRREVLEQVLPRLLVKEFAFDIEILAVAKHLGFTRIFEAPAKVTLGLDTTSTFGGGALLFFSPHIRKMLVDTLAVFYRIYVLDYYSGKVAKSLVGRNVPHTKLSNFGYVKNS